MKTTVERCGGISVVIYIERFSFSERLLKLTAFVDRFASNLIRVGSGIGKLIVDELVRADGL